MVADAGVAVTPPGAPTGVSASLGTAANSVAVSFVGPTASGGSAITGYSVASNPVGLSGSGNASPITVTCPSACSGYSFTVLASNRAGAGAPSAAAEVLTSYQIKATFFEPDTQPQDTIFTGSFTLNSTTLTVSGLSGLLTESMTGPPMITVPLTYQLSSVSDGSAGLLVSSFALNFRKWLCGQLRRLLLRFSIGQTPWRTRRRGQCFCDDLCQPGRPHGSPERGADQPVGLWRLLPRRHDGRYLYDRLFGTRHHGRLPGGAVD